MNDILSHFLAVLAGAVFGSIGTYYANRKSDKAKVKDVKNERNLEIENIISLMPKFIEEIKTDLSQPELSHCRIMYISKSKSIRINVGPKNLVYYEDEHDSLMSKIKTLEHAGLVEDIAEKSLPKYLITEELVNAIK